MQPCLGIKIKNERTWDNNRKKNKKVSYIFSVLQKILGAKLKIEADKLSKITKSKVAVPMEAWSYAQNQLHSSVRSWHIAYLILGITFGICRCAWPIKVN